MKKIKLSKGKVALVDNEDYIWLNQWKWHFMAGGYAMRHLRISEDKNSKLIYMHRQILNTPKGLESDHINRNKLDNRKENLRVATRSQNNMNRKKRINCTSKYKGVSWHKQRKKWQARTFSKWLWLQRRS